MDQKVLVALSGGVDSAVAAWLLKEQGVPVAAAYMKNWVNEEEVFGHCPWAEDIEAATAVARHLNIDFQVLNFIESYRERVVRYLVEGYARGITPNPDVMCNREMKFGVLLDWAKDHGFTHVATGHYCRRISAVPALASGTGVGTTDGDGDGFELWEGVDANKDQSYFLAMITPEQLEGALFPIGHLTKPEVRATAARAGLPNATRPDSQGICFIGQVRINDFLEKYIPDRPGEIVTREGKVLGEHRGLHRYTIGQRRGVGLPSNSDFNHFVVIAKSVADNRLVVAFEKERPPEIWHQGIALHHLSWLTRQPPQGAFAAHVKVRYRDPKVPAMIHPEDDGTLRVEFAEAQRALASGQVCAIYGGERLQGGGVYC